MHITDFSIFNKRRCESENGFNHKLNDWTLSDWFLAFIGEAGEAANVAKKLNRIRDGIPGNRNITEAELRAQLRREIADAYIYLDLMAQSEGIDLEAAVIETFDAKSEQIGYGVRLAKIIKANKL